MINEFLTLTYTNSKKLYICLEIVGMMCVYILYICYVESTGDYRTHEVP